MANELMITGDRANVPAHIAKRFEGRVGNVMDMSISVPQLTFAGKVFTIQIGSEKIKLISKNEDGDEQPVGVLPVVILDYTKLRGRSFYSTGYDPNNPSQPDCWSANSLLPDPSVDEPISTKCDGCPKSVKGSAMTNDNKPAIACGFYRLLALVPAPLLKKKPLHVLRMRIAQTSDYDGQSKEAQAKGLFGFSNYQTFLKNRGFEHTSALITKLSFDPSQAYPKLFFRTDRWLDETEIDIVDNIPAETIRGLLGNEMDMPAGGRVALPASSTAANKPIEAAAAPADTGKKPTAAEKKAAAKAAEAEAAKAAEAVAAAAAAAGDGSMVIDAEADTTQAVVEEDEDDKAIRLAQERKAAKAAAKANGGGGGKPAETKPNTAPTEAKEVTGEAGNLSDLLRDFE